MNNCVFCSNPIKELIMRKMKIGIYCYLIADILTKFLWKCSLSNPLPNTWILFKLLNLIACDGNWKAKFVKKYSKLISSEAISWMKLKHCRNAPVADPEGISLFNPLNLIGWHGNRKAKFAKKILKNHLLRGHKGDEAETLQNCSWIMT